MYGISPTKREPQYRSQQTIILIVGSFKKEPLLLGNLDRPMASHLDLRLTVLGLSNHPFPFPHAGSPSLLVGNPEP